ncbi:hypothetical protein [Thauera sinica]|uniref:Uncharacterized protein n=1 Tax=Thauera sinica TaxID=2665146 RepID=A0ABW1AVU1_9RHOO|nr:hypothetical protein [Thauera sp. K11]ATE61632.1 hypothetical protein CCZ27_18185 [Thauera sp. K11]
MAVPAIAWAILELVSAAITAYEIYDLSRALYDGVGEFSKNVEAAKAEIRKNMEALMEEIAAKVDHETERAALWAATEADGKIQQEVTRQASGRGARSPLIQTAIQQKIPFRQVISMVCDQADRMPVVSVRRRPGAELKDLGAARKKVLLEILAAGATELGYIEDIDQFIVVRQKQLMASLIFEFMDDLVEWASPLKAEASFGPGPGYADPPLEGTRLLRRGPSINPFYPLPHRGRGSLAADLAIPDYRKTPLRKDNVFALVEIKFERDKIENRQFEGYKELSDRCAKVKTEAIGKARTYGGKGVTLGCRVSLFRYPEDKAKARDEDGKPARAGSQRKPGRKHNR